MAVLGGGMWGGIAQGLKDMDDRALEQKKMDAMDADIAARNRGADLQEQQLGMVKDMHQVKMDEVKRAGRVLDIDAIGKTFGAKDPSAYEVGLDHATRSGRIITDPATGKRGIRADDLQKTMAYLDSAQGVEQVSKRNIVMLTDQLKKATDPGEIQTITDRLNTEKQHNKGAMKWLELQETAKQKGLDRESHEKVARINKAPGAERPGESAYREAMTNKLKAETEILKAGGKLDDKVYQDLAKHMGSADVSEELRMIRDPKERALREQQIEDEFLRRRTGGKKTQLGGSTAVPSGATGRRTLKYNPANGRYE
jgi:hypothetical protein